MVPIGTTVYRYGRIGVIVDWAVSLVQYSYPNGPITENTVAVVEWDFNRIEQVCFSDLSW